MLRSALTSVRDARFITPRSLRSAALCAVLAIAGCAGQERPIESVSARLLRVSDGDTIRVRLESGELERVRYIGIDAPERGACGSRRAARVNARLLGRGRLRFEFDAARRDRYGRLLAYVYAGDTFVNAELIRRAAAIPMAIAPNLRYANEFERLAVRTRSAGKIPCSQ